MNAKQARAAGTLLATMVTDLGVRDEVESIDWSVMALRQQNRKSWDAITQLIHYTDVVGRNIPVSVQSIQSGALFVEAPHLSDKS